MRGSNGWTVPWAGIDTLSIHAVTDPIHTAAHLATCAVTPADRCGNDSLVREVRRSMPIEMLHLLRPLGHDGPRIRPECLSPAVRDVTMWVDAVLGSAAILEEQMLVDNSGALPVPWRAVVRNPTRWLRSYVAACLHIRRIVLNRLGDAHAVLDRELVRVGTAAAGGAREDLLTSLFEGSSRTPTALRVPAIRDKALRLSAESLTLIPVLGGPGFRAHIFSGSTVTHFVYPISARPGSTTGVASLLGTVRAQLLHDLTAPRTPGTLSTRHQLSPGTITHHIDALVNAGLAERHRHGRHTLIHRTDRGTALIDLYCG